MYVYIFFRCIMYPVIDYSISAINKNSALINFLCGELTRVGRFIEAQGNFLVAGHTKFYPDLLFACLAISLLHSDIFNQLYVKTHSNINKP